VPSSSRTRPNVRLAFLFLFPLHPLPTPSLLSQTYFYPSPQTPFVLIRSSSFSSSIRGRCLFSCLRLGQCSRPLAPPWDPLARAPRQFASYSRRCPLNLPTTRHQSGQLSTPHSPVASILTLKLPPGQVSRLRRPQPRLLAASGHATRLRQTLRTTSRLRALLRTQRCLRARMSGCMVRV
jgi:hypothetical protein